jgi:hypothetical protein
MPDIRSAWDPGNAEQVRRRDEMVLKDLRSASESLANALRQIPNSVHTGFELPLDVQEITRCRRSLQTVEMCVEENHRKQDEEATNDTRD